MTEPDATEARDPFTPPCLAPRDPGFAEKVKRAFAAQAFLAHLGARLDAVAPGAVALSLEVRPEMTQHHGVVHGGVLATLLDVAGGFAAMSLTPPNETVLTAELTLHLLAPGRGVRLTAHGRVLKPGRRLLVAEARLSAIAADGRATLAATAIGAFATTAETA